MFTKNLIFSSVIIIGAFFTTTLFAADSVLLNVKLKLMEMVEGQQKKQNLETSLTVFFDKTILLANVEKPGSGSENQKIEKYFDVAVTPTKTPEGHVQLEFKVTRNNQLISTNRIITEFGRPATIRSDGKDQIFELDVLVNDGKDVKQEQKKKTSK